MIGHDPGKPGAWFEEGYVVLQLLRLIAEEVESVTWELVHEDGEGLDCQMREGGECFAVQCKTRSTGSWTIRRLSRSETGRSVLAWARDKLENGTTDRFRFVTDAPCPELTRLSLREFERKRTRSPKNTESA